MSVEQDILDVLRKHGYHLGTFACDETAIGEAGCGQGFRLKLKLLAQRLI